MKGRGEKEKNVDLPAGFLFPVRAFCFQAHLF